jgi:hypothetical protein
MSALSPAAQVVRDAAWAAFWSTEAMAPNDAEVIAAAALRAAVDQVLPEESPRPLDRQIRRQFLAIAAELDGGNSASQED